MNQTQVIAKLQKLILKNAALLRQCDLMISDRAGSDASQKRTSKVKVLYRNGNGRSKEAIHCKDYNNMPFHELPNASVYLMRPRPFNWLSAAFGVQERTGNSNHEILN